MRDPNLKALTVYVDKSIYDVARRAAEADARSVTNYLARLITCALTAECPLADLERMTGKRGSAHLRPSTAPGDRSARQVDIEDAIVAAVKRGPSKSSKHK